MPCFSFLASKKEIEEEQFTMLDLYDELNIVDNSATHVLQDYDKYGQMKILFAQALQKNMLTYEEFKPFVFQRLFNEKTLEIKEILYIAIKDQLVVGSNTFEHLLLSAFDEEQVQMKNLIKSIPSDFPNLVIKIPDWFNNVAKQTALDTLDYAIFPAVRKVVVANTSSVKLTTGNGTKGGWLGYKIDSDDKAFSATQAIPNIVPIQVKESEKLIPILPGNLTTIWGDNLVKDHFPILQTCGNPTQLPQAIDYDYRTSQYDFVSIAAMNKYINAARSPLSTDECVPDCERDCRTEKNVIEGIRLGNIATFKVIDNQPIGEDEISLHYQFVATVMCGDPAVSGTCEPRTWHLIFNGTVNDFFEVQKHYGTPLNSELADVIYYGRESGRDFYDKSFS